MPTLFSPFGLANKIAEKAQADGHGTIALDAGFVVDDAAASVTMTLKVADIEGAQPFAFRTFTPDEFGAFVEDLQNMRARLTVPQKNP